VSWPMFTGNVAGRPAREASSQPVSRPILIRQYCQPILLEIRVMQSQDDINPTYHCFGSSSNNEAHDVTKYLFKKVGLHNTAN
jgi:hypothetical protein